MLTAEKELPLLPVFLDSFRAERDKLLFFDIETTGFSRENDQIYLIGCLDIGPSSFHLVQWFADAPGEEGAVIRAFCDYCRDYSVLVHFNGRRFDLPFLRRRAEICGVSAASLPADDRDIYLDIRPGASLLGLTHLRQKDIEAFLGIAREDRYSGGELIRVYAEYLRSRKSSDLALLLLHNADDLAGLPQITHILRYPVMLRDAAFVGCGRTSSRGAEFVTFSYRGGVEVPRPVSALFALPDSAGLPGIRLSLDGRDIALNVPLIGGEMKRFYPDYRNYYYLPLEDCAIHRSVGRFVDAAARKPATARTCYTRVSGTFLPDPFGVFPVSLKKEYGAQLSCTPYDDAFAPSAEQALRYLTCIASAHLAAEPAGPSA